jgi:hypothetical protein
VAHKVLLSPTMLISFGQSPSEVIHTDDDDHRTPRLHSAQKALDVGAISPVVCSLLHDSVLSAAMSTTVRSQSVLGRK